MESAECRFLPPTPLIDGNGAFVQRWPRVLPQDWCSEWRRV
jgi:hypothetical protein